MIKVYCTPVQNWFLEKDGLFLTNPDSRIFLRELPRAAEISSGWYWQPNKTLTGNIERVAEDLFCVVGSIQELMEQFPEYYI